MSMYVISHVHTWSSHMNTAAVHKQNETSGKRNAALGSLYVWLYVRINLLYRRMHRVNKRLPVCSLPIHMCACVQFDLRLCPFSQFTSWPSLSHHACMWVLTLKQSTSQLARRPDDQPCVQRTSSAAPSYKNLRIRASVAVFIFLPTSRLSPFICRL